MTVIVTYYMKCKMDISSSSSSSSSRTITTTTTSGSALVGI